jgi:Ca2+-binding RTX toxin-like protein
MGMVSWTAVNAFGDANAARRATARLERGGHTVVAADRHRSDDVGADLMAIIGSARDIDRIVRMLERLHDQVAALAIVGGPLGVLLDQSDGLTVPTLVVGERVGRRVRRRASRRLPRGSVVVRSADFDAALDDVLTFLDRTASGSPASMRAGAARRVAERLAPVGLVAPAAIVMLAGSGTSAAGTCTPDPGDESLIIICEGEGVELALQASDGLILLDGKEIGKLDQFHKISLVTTGGDDLVTIDESAQKFVGAAGPITFDLKLGEGIDGLKWLGSADGDDDFKLTSGVDGVDGVGLRLAEVEHKIAGADLFQLDGGGGSNKLDVVGGDGLIELTGDALTLNFAKIEIEYSKFSDLKLTGGVGDNEFKISDFKFDAAMALKLDAGGGANKLDLKFDDALIEVTNEALSLNFAKIELDYSQFGDLKLTGGVGDTEYKIHDFKFDAAVALKLDDGGGANTLDLKFDDALIEVTNEALSLNFAKIELDYEQFGDLKLTGGVGDTEYKIHDFKFDAAVALKLDGGEGANTLDLKFDDDLIKISDTELSLNFAKVEIEYSKFSDLKLSGGLAADTFEIADFTGALSKLHLDGGDGAADAIKLTSPGSLKITDSLIGLGDKLDAIDYKLLESAEFLGGSTDSKIEIANPSFSSLKLDVGGGRLDLTTNDSLIKISDTEVSLDFGKLEYSQVGLLELTGGDAANKFELDGFTGKFPLVLDGGGGIDALKISTGAASLKITDSAVTLDGKIDVIGHKFFEQLAVVGSNDIAHTFDGSTVETLTLAFSGGAQHDLFLGGKLDDSFAGGLGDDVFRGGLGDDQLDGGAGADELDGAEGNDMLVAGAGADRAFGGVGIDTLVGGDGNDLLDAGDGDDTIVAGAGDDLLLGGLGRDDMNGGSGRDTADVNFGGDRDKVKGIEHKLA